MAVPGYDVERRPIACVLCVGVGSAVEQQPDGGLVAALGCAVQRRPTTKVFGLDVGSAVDQ